LNKSGCAKQSPDSNAGNNESTRNDENLSPRLIGPPTSTPNNASRKLKQCFNTNYKNLTLNFKQAILSNIDGKDKKVNIQTYTTSSPHPDQ
jgi:hypothetical protein